MVISMDADLRTTSTRWTPWWSSTMPDVTSSTGVRSSREKDTFFKRFTCGGFYRVMNFLGAETVFNHADYRLMSNGRWRGSPVQEGLTSSLLASYP